MKNIFSVAHDLSSTVSAGPQLLKFLHINVFSHFNFIHRLTNNLILLFRFQVNQSLNKNSSSKTRVGGKKVYVAAEI